ncbi:hypothetical protein GCM10027066_07360 [Dyella jejuensis]
MSYLSAVVYDPPKVGFPYLAVIFDTSGEVLSARAVPNPDAGEAFLAEIMTKFAREHGLEVK